MLQQTRVAAVTPYYLRFLHRFPDLASLAAASEQEILAFWSGLGYYSRAKNLQKAAREILNMHGGKFPADFEEILALPGIGRYTAGAICSLAFGQPYPVVDGNIRRVVTRLHGLRTQVPEAFFWDQMRALLPRGRVSEFNQAMMELGALVCVPTHPRCPECPVANHCRGCQLKLQDSLPGRRNKSIHDVSIVVLILVRNSRTLIISQKESFVPGDWGLPFEIIPRGKSGKEVADRLSRRILGREIPLACFGRLRHSISDRRIAAELFWGRLAISVPRFGSGRWLQLPGLQKALVSSLYHKAVQKFLGSEVPARDEDS
jgi:A/G-specific adenine glycosylase